MTNKLDALGKQLTIGDTVVRSRSGYKGLSVTVITGFSPVMVKTRSGLEYPQDLLLLTKEEGARFKKHL